MNSGDVVVGAIGDDLHMDYTAIGHTVGLAQRMEALATPGQVYLTEHTARLVDGWFGLKDLGATDVKGAGAPLGVYVLEGPRGVPSSYAVARARGLSRLVGREHELAEFGATLTRARGGNAQVVGVVGEAGVGKSRLCEEFAQTCVAQGITVKRGHGLSYGKHMPLLPILEFFRNYFDIGDADTPQQAREKIAGRLVLLGASIDDDLPAFFESEAFLEQLIESYPGTRTLTITNFRPEFHARWMRHSYYRQIALSSLDSEESRLLVGALVGEAPSLRPLVDSLTERTAGKSILPRGSDPVAHRGRNARTHGGRIQADALTRPPGRTRHCPGQSSPRASTGFPKATRRSSRSPRSSAGRSRSRSCAASPSDRARRSSRRCTRSARPSSCTKKELIPLPSTGSGTRSPRRSRTGRS